MTTTAISPLPTTSGSVLLPGDAGYDDARAGYNLSVVHHPAVIVVAADAADVVAAVGYATRHGLAVAVQATGHGPTTSADGAVLIDTSRMAGIEIDPAGRARFGAGVRSGDLVRAAAAHGLAPLNGSAPGVGAVAYHLGGGIGMLGRQLGYAADHVLAIEVVTADGRLRRVTADRHTDLFWALRGGGKVGLGVVVAMEIALHRVARLHGGAMHFTAERTPELLHTYADWVRTVPETMGSSILMMRLPNITEVPAEQRGRFVSHLRVAFTGDAREGERLVRPFRDLEPTTDTVGEMAYRDVGTIHAEPTVPVAFHARNSGLHSFDADAAATLVRHAGPESDVPYLVELRHLGRSDVSSVAGVERFGAP